MILVERLKEEIQRRRIPPNQTGFRKRMGTIDDTCAELFGHQAIGKEGEVDSVVCEHEGSFLT